MKLVYAVIFTIAFSVAADTALYPVFNTGVQNRFDVNAPIQEMGSQRTYLQGGIPLNTQEINRIGNLPALQNINLFNKQLTSLQGNALSRQQSQFVPRRFDWVINHQGFQNPGAYLNLGTLPFKNNRPTNPEYNSQLNLGQVAQSLNQPNQARQLGNFIGGGIPASVGTTPNNQIGLKANFGSIPINGLSAAIQQKQLDQTQIIARGQNLQGLNGIAGNSLLQTHLTGVPYLSNQLNKSQFNQIAMNSSLNPLTPYNNIRNLNIKMLPNFYNTLKVSANNPMQNRGQLQTNVASNPINHHLYKAQLSNPIPLSNVFNQNSIDNAFYKMFEVVNKYVANSFKKLIKQVDNVAQIINEGFSNAINQLDKALLSNLTIPSGNHLNHSKPNFMNISLINPNSNFLEEFNKGIETANMWNKQNRNIGQFPFHNWHSRLVTGRLLPIFDSVEKSGVVSDHPQTWTTNSLPHPISSNSTFSKLKSTLTIVNTTDNSTSLKNITEISAILSDDGKNLRDYLVKINSTQDILSKWDAVVKDKVKGTRINLTSYSKTKPFCSCDGVLSCNCCLTLNLAVIKKEVCLEASAPKTGNGSQVSIIMDNKRQNFTKTNGEKNQVEFDLEGLANGNLEIASQSSTNNTTQREFCVSASLNLLGLSFTSIPLGCFSPTNQTISIRSEN